MAVTRRFRAYFAHSDGQIPDLEPKQERNYKLKTVSSWRPGRQRAHAGSPTPLTIPRYKFIPDLEPI